MIDTAEFATLAEEGTRAIDMKANLIEAARAGVHLYTKRRKRSAV
jgi:hypothetical protein